MPALLKLAGQTEDRAVHDLANDVIKTVFAPTAYSRAEVEQIQKLCECHATRIGDRSREQPMGPFGSPRAWPVMVVCF